MNKIKKESLGILIASTNRESLLDLIKCIKKDIFEDDRVLIVFDGISPDDAILKECELDSRIEIKIEPNKLGFYGHPIREKYQSYFETDYIHKGNSILESVRIGDTETSAKTGIDIINNSYRMRLGGPNAPSTASVKFEIVDSTDAVLGTCTINKENCNIPGYQYFTVFTGYEDWVFYTKDNKVYMSSLNSTVESGEGKELIRFEMIPDASVITGPVLLRMTADGGVYNADINGTVEGYNGQ